MLHMFLICIRIDKNVIDVNNYPTVQHVPEDIVDEGLEYRRTVGKAEGHNRIFIVPSAGGKSCFPFITLPDADEIIGVAEV